MNNSDDAAKAASNLRRSVLLWSVFALFILGFVAVAFIAPDELGKANVKPSTPMLAMAAAHGVLLLLASLFSIKANQISLYTVTILLVLALGYAIVFKSLFAAIFIGLLIVNAIATLWSVHRYGPEFKGTPVD